MLFFQVGELCSAGIALLFEHGFQLRDFEIQLLNL